MRIENHKCFNLSNRGEFEPQNIIKSQLDRVDIITRSFNEVKPDDSDLYIRSLRNKFSEILGDYEFNIDAFNWEVLRKDLEFLPKFPELEKLIFLYTCQTLKLPIIYKSEQGKIELGFYDWIKTFRRVSYYLVRTIADIYGKEKGIEIYNQIISYFYEDLNSKHPIPKPDDPKSVNIVEFNEQQIKNWCKCGLADFTLCMFDDYKVIYRFDSCLTPEVLKEFNDPDIAYVSSCYMTDHPEYNKGRIVNLRRTQTLHHAEFCDEMYWNNYVHPDAEQPSLEFTARLGKE